MFVNLMTKVEKIFDFLIFCQCFFDFSLGNEQNCKIRIIDYDLNGKAQEEVDINKIANDFIFLVYGNYMIVWLGQIFDHTIKNEHRFKKMFLILSILFGLDRKYSLSDALKLFDQETKSTVIKNHSSVQFKINKKTKNLLVRVVDIPITKMIEGEMYLFILLFDFFCKKYNNAHKLLCTGCGKLMKAMADNNFSTSKSFQALAYEIIGTMAEDQWDIILEE